MSPAPTARDQPVATSLIGPRMIFESSPTREAPPRPPTRFLFPNVWDLSPGRGRCAARARHSGQTALLGIVLPAHTPSSAETRLYARTRARRSTR